jgi:hypothetical protein
MKTMSQPRLSYPELLNRAQAESARLENSIYDLRRQDYELSALRNRVNIQNLDALHNQRKELFINIFYLEADLRRSRGREAILRRNISEGKVREPELAAVA